MDDPRTVEPLPPATVAELHKMIEQIVGTQSRRRRATSRVRSRCRRRRNRGVQWLAGAARRMHTDR